MTAFRRLTSNFAFERAIDLARELDRPLIVLEALRCDYRWASDRLHAFVIDGMAEHARALARQPVAYFPYVEPTRRAGQGLVEALARDACVVVTDDYPCFFLPRMLSAAASRVGVRVEAVDSNGILPMRGAARTFTTARSLRAHLYRTLRVELRCWPARISFRGLKRGSIPRAIARRWKPTPVRVLASPARLVASLPIDHDVPIVSRRGGSRPARTLLKRFISARLDAYADRQRRPEATSELSPYLHFGHISAHEIFEAVMTHERWTSRKLARQGGGHREGWWGVRRGAEAFLDQLVTWRELGFNMCATRPDDYDAYESLPDWARRTLGRHARDRRHWTYSRRAFAAARTHDPVWNLAQQQLVHHGWMHNYLRMIWGKKILEWSPTPEAALATMIELMNRYALDGRDPNSYSGYFWTLGRYDHPWGPERPVFGTVRYMKGLRKSFFPYSPLSATTGSTRMARRAGT